MANGIATWKAIKKVFFACKLLEKTAIIADIISVERGVGSTPLGQQQSNLGEVFCCLFAC